MFLFLLLPPGLAVSAPLTSIGSLSLALLVVVLLLLLVLLLPLLLLLLLVLLPLMLSLLLLLPLLLLVEVLPGSLLLRRCPASLEGPSSLLAVPSSASLAAQLGWLCLSFLGGARRLEE